ncbi:transposase, partial [Streptomyces sp. NPDC026665]|uniref:transposase n=1 Tax=Streptomyces sp. NPDC026665 TaxID=3154798 RepID=UPI0033C2C244
TSAAPTAADGSVDTSASDGLLPGVATTDRNRPVYPVVFIDCINVKIREGRVANRPAYMALAVTAEGQRD